MAKKNGPVECPKCGCGMRCTGTTGGGSHEVWECPDCQWWSEVPIDHEQLAAASSVLGWAESRGLLG